MSKKNVKNLKKKSNNDNLNFQILDWDTYHEVEEDEDGDISKKFTIRLYGTTEDNKKIFVRVDDFTPYFFVQIPKVWRKNKIQIFVDEIRKKVGGDRYGNSADTNRNSLVNWDVVDRHIFWNFTNYETHNFVRLIFNSYEGFRAYERVFNKKVLIRALAPRAKKYRLFESNIEPMLRFMHIRNLQSCGWATLEAGKYKHFPTAIAPSYNDINVHINWKHVNPYDNDNVSRLVIASYDIECTSGDGSFPLPERLCDKVIQIGTTYNYYGEKECYYKHIITLGSCDPIEGADVESYETEEEVLLAWTKLIQRTNPDIMTGYNIFGFDYRYLQARAKLLGIDKKFDMLGRIKKRSPFIQKVLASAALGDNELFYYATNGRIQIDLLKVVMRDFNLNSYKLDSVASEFIREAITGVDVDEKNGVSVIHTNDTYGLEVGRVVKIYFNDGLSDNIYRNEAKFEVLDFASTWIKIKGVLDDEALEYDIYKVFWCQAKDDVTAQDIFKMQEGSSTDRATVAKYCIQDCVLVNKIMAKLDVVTNNIGMANVCHVPLSYIFLRGQGVKIFSLVSKKCRQKNHLIPVIRRPWRPTPEQLEKMDIASKQKFIAEMEAEKDEDDGYEGATVLDPNPSGVHFEPIPVLDYASLYPSSMIEKNISHECIVTNPKYDNLPGYTYQNVTYKNNDGTEKTCRYAKSDKSNVGILPEILMELLAARKRTRQQIGNETDKFKQKILDGLQLAYKITANSLYGQTGAKTSPIYYKDIAASTTATGRDRLLAAQLFAEKILPQVVNPILKNDYALYSERMNKLFDKQKLGGVEMFPGTKVEEKRFINDKLGHTCRKDFIDYFFKEVKSLLKGMTIDPSCVYGDSVTSDTPVLIRHNGEVFVKTIDNLNKGWKPHEGFKPDDNSLKDKQQNEDLVDYEIWSDNGWTKINRVIRHKCNKKIYRILTHTGSVDVTEDHSLLDKDGKIIKPSECMVGTELLHSELPGSKKSQDGYDDETQYCFNNKLDAMKTFYLLKLNGYHVIVDDHDADTIKLTCNSKQRQNPIAIKKIVYLGYTDDYVYDIETQHGRFNAGVGEITVKNTDSIFVNYNIADKETGEMFTDYDHLITAIKLGVLTGDLINMILPHPQNLEYEKTFWPYILLTKKRYVGNLYEFDPNKFYQKSMGIVLKRRDNAPIVKIVVGGIVREILNERSPQKAIDFAKNELRKILSGKYKMDKFIITKTLRAEYKDRTRIVHAVLADRIGERDPGNKPQSNDRIPYVYIETDKEVKLQGDHVEHPDYIAEHNLKIDYLFYITNQIMKPAIQFLEHVVKNPQKIFDSFINRELNRRKGKKPIKAFFSSPDEKKKESSMYFDGFDFEDDDKEIKNDDKAKKSTRRKTVSKSKRPVNPIEAEYNDEGGFSINI